MGGHLGLGAILVTDDYTGHHLEFIKSVSMRKPGRARQEVIQLKSPILFKLGINVGFGEQMIMART